MASSSSIYLTPESSSTSGAKLTLVKPTTTKTSQLPAPIMLHSTRHATCHQLPYSLKRSSTSLRSFQQFSRTVPSSDTFHSPPVPNINNGTSLSTAHGNHIHHNNNSNNNTVPVFTNNIDDGSGCGGHSLSQSMESIDNVDLTVDEVSKKGIKFFL